MYVATESAMPLVVLGGSSAGNQRGLGAFQEADQVAFAAPACKWATQVDSQARIAEYVHLALGRALNGRPGAVYLDFPAELIRTPFEEEHVEWRTSEPDISRPHPDPDALATVADMLAEAERPLVIMGKGAGWAEAGLPLQRLVDRGIPFVSSPMGRGAIPDDHPMFMNAARSAALGGADAVLMVGGRFNWVFQFGKAPRFAEGARLAHIDIVAEEFFSGADVETGIVADCAVAVEQLNGLLDGRSLRVASGDWVGTLQEARDRNEAGSEEAMASDEVPINHFRLLRDVRDCLDRDATVTVDAELTMGVARAVMPSFGSRLRLNSGTTGCMGTGLPYAIGAKLARPDQQVVAVLGDYAFGAAAMEVETAARIGCNVVIVVSNNGGIAGHSIQDRTFAPDAPPIAALLPVAYEKTVEMVGGWSRRVEDPADIAPAVQEALAADTVALVNVLTDPKGRRSGSAYLG
jgi:thiamine pyrophosphate-dependent acetolactate synthase large subunit-like protein